ncbi:MAG: SDR family oxidoreductase [Betaproteobacteria bacterium]|nr:SDR family oxidoreductase [Betaproteobacteria bacterium]
MRLQDRVAIVTGSGSGIRKTMVKRFTEEGASVVIADINQEAVDTVVRELKEAGRTALGFKVDVTNRSELKELMKTTASKFGRIDILVNNAGVTRNRPFQTMNGEDWDFVLRVDLKGVFYCVQAVAEYMINQRYGKIVNISSTLGTGTTPGVGSGTYNYAAAKAGVIQLTKTLARELGPHGINVNCVAPGNVGKSTFHSTRTPQEMEKHLALRRSLTVLNRTGTLEEIANAVLFLVSDESSFISGQLLCVDGGRTDRM